MTLEKLANEIMAECEKNNEPVTFNEAFEMAKMEINNKEITRYEKSDSPRKRAIKVRKVDENKKRLLMDIKVLLEGLKAKIIEIKTETEIEFIFNKEIYTLKLIKHRPKKEDSK